MQFLLIVLFFFLSISSFINFFHLLFFLSLILIQKIDNVDNEMDECGMDMKKSGIFKKEKILDKKDFANPNGKSVRVHFAEIIYKVIVFEDSLEDVDSRSKYWEYQAVNRDRFSNRIKKLENQLLPILDKDHRSKIYEQRFKGLND